MHTITASPVALSATAPSVRRSAVALVAVVAVVAAATQVGADRHSTAPIPAAAPNPVLSALQATPGLLESSAGVVAVTTTDSASVSTVAGNTADMPRDPNRAVLFTTANGAAIQVTVPAAAGIVGSQIAPGVVAYAGLGASHTAVQATDNGGLRMMTVIDGPDAPEDYTYGVDLPSGGSVAINPDGTASVRAADSTAVAVVQAPWARDANGVSVPTSFSTDGRSLTQHISFRGRGVAYPVTADPWFWSYLGCILGAGVPAGAAIFFASEVGTMTALRAIWAGRKAIPAGGPGYSSMQYYATRVYNACRNFINS